MSDQYYFFWYAYHFHPSRATNFLPCKWGLNLLFKLSYLNSNFVLTMVILTLLWTNRPRIPIIGPLRILGDPGAVSRVGGKGRTKIASTGKRAPGYRLSPNYLQKFKPMPAPDWAQKCLVLLCPIGEQFLLSSFREFVHDGFFFEDVTSDNKLNFSFPLNWIEFTSNSGDFAAVAS